MRGLLNISRKDPGCVCESCLVRLTQNANAQLRNLIGEHNICGASAVQAMCAYIAVGGNSAHTPRCRMRFGDHAGLLRQRA